MFLSDIEAKSGRSISILTSAPVKRRSTSAWVRRCSVAALVVSIVLLMILAFYNDFMRLQVLQSLFGWFTGG